MRRRLGAQHGADEILEFVDVGYAIGIGAEARIDGPLRVSQRFTKSIKLAIARNAQHDLPVARGQGAIRSERFVPSTLRLWIPAGELAINQMIGHEEDAGLK